MKTVLTSGLLSDSVIERQMRLEVDAVTDGVARYREQEADAIRRGEGATLKPAERLLLHWFIPFREAIEMEQQECYLGIPAPGRLAMGGIIQVVDPGAQAYITLHAVIGRLMLHPNGDKITKTAYAVGRDIMAEAMLQTLKQSRKEQLRELELRIKRFRPRHINRLARKTLADQVWRARMLTHLGCRLIWLLEQVATVDDYGMEFKPAFERETRQISAKRRVNIIRMAQEAIDIINDGHFAREKMRPKYQPMIHAPVAWTRDQEGGYDRLRAALISKITPNQRLALEQSDLERFYPYVNGVNATAFRIIKPVLETEEEIWSTGGNEIGIPRREDAPFPEKPVTNDDAVLKKYRMECGVIARENRFAKGDRKNFLTALSSAHRFSDEPAIWFPHQLDFRSRMYPLPASFNHQGEDYQRALCMFAESKPLNDRGRRWLLIHAANCFGVDRVSFDDRVKWAEGVLPSMPECPEKAVDEQYWKKADKPFQFLAACFAYHNPDLAARLPGQVDGSCNGLQQFAALTRDLGTARSVNLVDREIPARIYRDVADVVRRRIEEEIDNGKEMASTALPQVDDDLVKQVVMTTVYGVTRNGAKGQISKKLKDRGFPREGRYDLAVYIANKTMTAMRELCPKAVDAMDWLKDCARQITGSGTNEPVEWQTPLGFIVHQPYMNLNPYKVNTLVGQLTLRLEAGKELEVAPGKQIKGVVPNYVHSIDASHMMMTAKACWDRGMNFAAVHDAYWSHLNDMDTLGTVLRREFVELHRVPLLDGLAEQWRTRYPKAKIKDPPELGALDIREVLGSTYFFN